MADSIDYMLTTVDNPFNPHTHYEEWLAYDRHLGYNTNEFLARLTFSSDELSEADQNIAIQTAIDEILEENVFGVHRKIGPPPDS